MRAIFVLENDPNRITAMREELARSLPDVQAQYADNAPEAIAYLRQHLPRLACVSLDHDLGGEELRNGVLFDPGSGRDVAAYIGEQTPTCSIIVHTDNFFVRPTMQKMLDAGGWHNGFVAPGNGVRWVAEQWIPLLKKFLEQPAES